MVTFSMTFTDP